MDAAIARIMDKLESLGIAEDTLVFFTSDNGYNMGHHGITGKGNGTFPLNMYEESVKVPFIASCPGRIPSGVINMDLLSHYDFMPTILDYLDIEVPVDLTLPGRSFAGLLRGVGNSGHQSVVICDEYGPTRMIREQNWKYVHRYPEGPHELYCLADDPEEQSNLANTPEHNETLKRMRGDLDAWFEQYVQVAFDGTKYPVTGKGQVDAIRLSSTEKTVFV